MSEYSVADALAGKPGEGQQVTIKGWVRTRRDCKGGFSFIAVNDGSCFDSIQVVAGNTLANYASESHEDHRRLLGHRHRHARASRRAKGRRSKSRRPRSTSSAGSKIPTPIRSSPSRTRWSICARSRTCGRARTPSARSRACGTRSRWRSTASSTSTASSGSTRRSSPPPMPKAPARCSASARSTLHNLPRTPEGKIDFAQDFFGKRDEPDRLRPAQRRDLLPGAEQGLHLRPDLPRRESSNTPRHLAEFWMIEPEIAFADLKADADLAEDRSSNTSSAPCSNERPDDMKFFAERIDKECINRVEKLRQFQLRADGLTPMRSRPWKSRGKKFEFPVKWGIDLQIGARALPHRGARQAPGRRHELSEGHQGVLHAAQRRRQNRRRDGRARPRHRRDHRRQPARGAARRARSPAWTR